VARLQVAANTFYRWRKAGIWAHVLGELQRQADAAGALDWALHHVDSTVVRAHQHTARAKGGSKGDAGTLARRLLDQGPFAL